MSMTKREQVRAIAQAAGLTSAQAHDALDAVAAVVMCGLLDGGKVKIDGLGLFAVHHRAPRRVRNPRTGVQMDLPASAVVKFKPVPELRVSVEERHG